MLVVAINTTESCSALKTCFNFLRCLIFTGEWIFVGCSPLHPTLLPNSLCYNKIFSALRDHMTVERTWRSGSRKLHRQYPVFQSMHLVCAFVEYHGTWGEPPRFPFTSKWEHLQFRLQWNSKASTHTTILLKIYRGNLSMEGCKVSSPEQQKLTAEAVVRHSGHFNQTSKASSYVTHHVMYNTQQLSAWRQL